MELDLHAVYQRDGDWIVAWLEEIPGVATQGKTIEEARENLADALQMMLDARREIAQRKLRDQAIVSRETFSVGA
jgi:predicted RNase H-like HicB family nuclease